MEQVLIHIGYHKTGTSWLQNELFIAGDTVFQPLSLKAKKQSTLAKHFIMDEDGYLLHSCDENTQVILQKLSELREPMLKAGNKIPVISSERLSGNPHSSGFDAAMTAKRLHKIFPQAKILIVIREQSSFIVSNYFQYLSAGGTHSISKYLAGKYDGKQPHFSPHHLSYHLLVQHYQVLFGTQQVLTLPYELFAADKPAFFDQLSKFVQATIHIHPERYEVHQNQKKNHFWQYRLRWLNHLQYSNSLNNYSTLKNSISRKSSQLLLTGLDRITPNSWHQGTINNVKKEVNAWMGSRYSLSNEKTRQITGLKLEGYS